MGSVLSLATAETAVVVIVTAACTTLAYTFVLRFTSASSVAKLAGTSSSQQPSIIGTRSKKKKRSAQNQTSAGAAEEAQTDPKSPRPGQRQVTSKIEPSRRDPVTIPSPKAIPGDFERRIETSTSTGNAEVHSSQEPGVATAKRGKKKKKPRSKANLVHPGSEAPVGDQFVQGASHEQPMLRESDGRSSSAVSKVKSKEAKPSHQQQPQLLNPDILLKRESRQQSSPSLDVDDSWTRVGSHRLKEADGKADVSVVVSTDFTGSDVGTSTAGESLVAEITDEEDIGDLDVAGTRRTLAEKLVPKSRRTGVEDMLQKPDVPTLARVMRVVSPTDEVLAQENYEDAATSHTIANDTDEEDEGGWDIVKGKGRSRNLETTLNPQQTTPPLPQPSADRTLTKKQRQNAKKREVLKVAKADAEASRLEGLAKHKRELERQRIIELSRSGGGKRPSGGMQAVVDDRGKLVWE